MNCSCSNKILSLTQLTFAFLGTTAAGAAFATAFVPTVYAVTGIALPIFAGTVSVASWLGLAGITGYRCCRRKVQVIKQTEVPIPSPRSGEKASSPAEQFLEGVQAYIERARNEILKIGLSDEDNNLFTLYLDNLFENAQNFSECIEEVDVVKECMDALERQIEEMKAIAEALKGEETTPTEKKEKEKEVSDEIAPQINACRLVASVQSGLGLHSFIKRFREKEPTAEDLETFEERLKAFKDINALLDVGHDSLLMALAKRGNPTQFVPILAKHGIDFNSRCSFFGNTPLMWAIANGNNEMALAIIEANPDQDFDAKDTFKKNSALILAIVKGYTIATSDGKRLKVSNLELVQALLDKGADPNQYDGKGNTPLKLAILRRDPEMVSALLKAGARFDFDCEPLLEWSYEQVAEKLKKTASPFLLDKAAFEQNKESVKAILKGK